MSGSAPRRKIIIDTDPGIDDAMAIFYALASPELEVLGLTTVFGNAHVEVCTANAIRLLDIAGRADIPVAHGAGRPLAMPYRGPADFVHGAEKVGLERLAPKGGARGRDLGLGLLRIDAGVVHEDRGHAELLLDERDEPPHALRVVHVEGVGHGQLPGLERLRRPLPFHGVA